MVALQSMPLFCTHRHTHMMVFLPSTGCYGFFAAAKAKERKLTGEGAGISPATQAKID